MGIIYKITNNNNGKIYIGQTICRFEKRWGEHISASKSDSPNVANTHFVRAIKKYGADAFTHEIIEESPNDELDEKEKYWIKYYNSTDPQVGYNITTGGHSCWHYDFDHVFSLWDKGLSIGEMEKQTGINRVTLRHMLETYPNYSKKESRQRGYKQIQEHHRKVPVSQYTVDGEYVASYESMIEAERKVPKTTRENISNCCKTRKGLSGGYQWRFLNDDPPARMEDIPGQVAVCQYDKQGNFIKRYRSMVEASQETGTHKVAICMCCRGKIPSAGGYKWGYANQSKEG